jgi:hypothetical protein
MFGGAGEPTGGTSKSCSIHFLIPLLHSEYAVRAFSYHDCRSNMGGGATREGNNTEAKDVAAESERVAKGQASSLHIAETSG